MKGIFPSLSIVIALVLEVSCRNPDYTFDYAGENAI